MFETILSAIALLAVDGTCLEASAYPTTQAGELTGYIVIQSCAIPTTIDADAPTLAAAYVNALDRAYGDGSKQWRAGECRIMPAGHDLAVNCRREDASQ